MLLKIKQHFGADFGLFGSGYPAQFGQIHATSGHAESNEIYNQSQCVVSISNYNDLENYFSDRLLMSLGSGKPVISYRFPGCYSYFTHGSDILIANNVQEIIQCIDYCVANPEKAREIGVNGQRKVLSEHTYRSRVIELLAMLNLKV